MKKYFLLFYLVAAFALEGLSQSYEAIFTANGSLVLDDTHPLTDHYELSTEAFNFESQQEALSYFRNLNAEFIAMRPIVENGVVHIYLQRKQKPEWTMEDWNAYTNEILNANQALKSKLIDE
ncbi:MAG TPA: hypothetical protein VJ894_05835 [Cryomorphaceae bacterium]|nr:hypothetical protein [Cryomorphaceae bacterium]